MTEAGWTVLEFVIHLANKDELDQRRAEGGERTLDLRFARAHAFVTAQVANGVKRIVFEDVTFASTIMTVQFWACLRTVAWAVALSHPQVSLSCVSVTTLKHFAIGDGHAQKSEMAQALALR